MGEGVSEGFKVTHLDLWRPQDVKMLRLTRYIYICIYHFHVLNKYRICLSIGIIFSHFFHKLVEDV